MCVCVCQTANESERTLSGNLTTFSRRTKTSEVKCVCSSVWRANGGVGQGGVRKVRVRLKK